MTALSLLKYFIAFDFQSKTWAHKDEVIVPLKKHHSVNFFNMHEVFLASKAHFLLIPIVFGVLSGWLKIVEAKSESATTAKICGSSSAMRTVSMRHSCQSCPCLGV
jgi:hypothetical protein